MSVCLIYGTDRAEPWSEYLLKVTTKDKVERLVAEFSKTWTNVRYQIWQVE